MIRLFPDAQCVGIKATRVGFGIPVTLYFQCPDGDHDRSFTVTSMQRDRADIPRVDVGEEGAVFLGCKRDRLPPHGSIVWVAP
ncbi:hypothetical protein ACFL0L_01290 [Patescibacteria group bacterium]